MAKSIVLLLWLLTGEGRQQHLLTLHVDSQAECQRMALQLTEKHAAKGEKVRTLCHEVIEEVGDVDEMGNPLPPGAPR